MKDGADTALAVDRGDYRAAAAEGTKTAILAVATALGAAEGVGALAGRGMAAETAAIRAAKGAGGGSVHPSTPVGRVQRGPLTVQTPGTNSSATIGGRDYTGHALDRMQQRGLVPSVVEDAIAHGSTSPGRVAGTTAYYSSSNNVTVITDAASGRVITTYPGQGKGF
jgi:filamentous hemagglutinin